MADPQKTEQPTKRRLEEARLEGQFPSARQFIAAMQFCTFVALLQYKGADWVNGVAVALRALMLRAFGSDLTPADVFGLTTSLMARCFFPLLEGGAILVLLGLVLQLAVTKMGFAVKKLVPDPSRLNPVSRLRQLPQQNIPALIHALILLPLVSAAVYAVMAEQLNRFVALPLAGVRTGMQTMASSIQSLLWRAAALFFVFGCVELFREKRRQSAMLRMTKHEVKDELKKTEGNPQIKARIRAIRRDQARRRMMQAVPTATAVIVNPTHFAVALKYDLDSMPAPIVVAKGKNYLALRIRQKALENQVPLIENPPLAQALYKSVNVGQEIPSHLYRAVAEILAYILRLTRRR